MSILEWCVIGWLLNLACILPMSIIKDLERRPCDFGTKMSALIVMLFPLGMLLACAIVGILGMFADCDVIRTNDNEQ